MPLLCYMNHDEHGSMPVYDAEQRKQMKKSGWVEESEKDYIKRRKAENTKKMNKSDDEVSYSDLSVSDLRSLCKARDLLSTGTAKALIKRLEENE